MQTKERIFKYSLLLSLLFVLIAILSLLFFGSETINPLAIDTPPPENIQPEQKEITTPVKTQIVTEDSDSLEDSPNTFPPIWCNYENSLGFDSYARAMEERGCVFFYFSKRQNMWRKINYTEGLTGKFDVSNVGKIFGNRPSKIADEKSLKRFLKDEVAGTDVFFGKPIAMEDSIRRTITQKLKLSGIVPSQLVGIRGVYGSANGKLYLRVKEIVQKEGGVRPFFCDVIL